MQIQFFLHKRFAIVRLRAMIDAHNAREAHYVGQGFGFAGVLRKRGDMRWLRLSERVRARRGHLDRKSVV